MNHLTFKAHITRIKDWSIIRLPEEISNLLPSRGMVMSEVVINDTVLSIALEPDGMKGHWFRFDEIAASLKLDKNSSIVIDMKPLKVWIEPTLPPDIKKSIMENNAFSYWNNITIKVRWEWFRWIRSTSNPKTRAKRLYTTNELLKAGKKRPCCYDTTRCTITYVSKNGKLEIK